jgi:Tol biopolymer transport system component
MRLIPLTAAASFLVAAVLACAPRADEHVVAAEAGETHLGKIRQLTFGGENAEAYFSADGRRLIFQSTRDGRTCDQQYVMNVDGTGVHKVSTGFGKTTCGYFFDADHKIFFASTHAADSACPPKPDPSKGYVWGLDPYDIYTANDDGSNLRALTHYGVYTAEGTLSPDGQTIAFTSLKDGDLDIYTMRTDGSNQHQITSLGGANFAPYFTPDDKRIIFSSNYKNPKSRNFDLYLVDVDGSHLEQVTNHPEFDGFPMFSPDGKQLVWGSGRASKPGELNLFIADWQ